MVPRSGLKIWLSNRSTQGVLPCSDIYVGYQSSSTHQVSNSHPISWLQHVQKHTPSPNTNIISLNVECWTPLCHPQIPSAFDMETGWDGEDLSAFMIPSGLPVSSMNYHPGAPLFTMHEVSDIVFDDPTVIFTEELVDVLNDNFTGFSWGPANIGLPITAFESNHSWPPPIAQPNYNIGNLALNVDPVSIQAPAPFPQTAPFPQAAPTPLHFCKPSKYLF